eukprot:gnl/MRDRNA2_/MRDRNA2_33700_c0_seq1.p1 gnl/MRDRNA2_/MRDRNA2_33700_c0~~gnl/MRDRNA2_/MRDRNA2_33700_c0_seq1.p1  ORF type:complete len:240 (-),score=47.82 gnl/MRDRNA2_/MRDRNA2_33700_c0_seq1:604-1323(-)
MSSQTFSSLGSVSTEEEEEAVEEGEEAEEGDSMVAKALPRFRKGQELPAKVVLTGFSEEALNDSAEKMSRLADVEISIAVSDPSLDDNPLIAISRGFTTLTGYPAEEIIGRNCRFLVEPVQTHRQCQSEERQKAREFSQACEIAALSNSSEPGPEDCCCVQLNCAKDGTLFWSMFLMHFVRIKGKAYVVALQHKLSEYRGTATSTDDQAFLQESIHLKASLEMALERLSIDHIDDDQVR